ncbi:MAG TPA: aspartate--tRNA(Asn) ligase [Nitrososphaeraceae archaeon]|nr:aspartate--tRNA(Asn) ligase [Nitrososphaeraceae archaeon]HEU5172096.1 aspartate--tRNA(Asn) ligase [Nitrososphaeraceae archaeon]
MKRTHFAKQLNEDIIGQNVNVAGWIEDIRDIGKIIFLVIRDITGPIQVIVNPKKFPGIKEIPRQSSIIISGEIQKSKSKEMRVELRLEEIGETFYAKHPLPIDPTGRLESAMDKRLDSRALDLRNENVSNLFIIRSIALEIIRKTLREQLFIEVNTPKIIGSASEGGANLFEFDYFKKKAYLAQSPQLYKEQLILAMDRVFEIAPYFRAENSNTVRHLTEFYSVDIEAAFLDYYDIMEIMEQLIKNILAGLKNTGLLDLKGNNFIRNSLANKFERLPYNKCIEELQNNDEKVEYGDDLSDSSLRTLGQLHQGFYFITEWPLKLKPFYILENDRDPFLSNSFDLQIGYLELISGGSRQHDPHKIKSRLKEQGLNPDNFSQHLKVFEWGMPPHAGCGLGLDRLIMSLTGSLNVREVVLYPRDPDRISP